MISMIRTKLSEFTTSFSGSKELFVMGCGIAAIISLFIGLPGAINFIMHGKIEGISFAWTLMGLSFFAGIVYQSLETETKHWQTKSIITPTEQQVASIIWNATSSPDPHKDETIPVWIGIGVFAVALLARHNIESVWQDLFQTLPQALMAWGTYTLLIQLPWSASLRSSMAKRTTQRHEFIRYVIEAKTTTTDEWESLHSAKDLDDCNEVLKSYAERKKTGEFIDIRVIEEVGIRQVRITDG